MIGLIILAVGLLGIVAMQVTSTKSSSFSNNVTRATILAQDKLEYLKNLSYRDSGLSSGQHDEGAISGTIFARHYTIVEDPGNWIKMITVTVQWADPKNHSISLQTIRSK